MATTLFERPDVLLGDSSFTRNRVLPLHRWVPWVAGFSAEFVQDSLNRYLPAKRRNPVVMDPFTGVGTTLLESYIQGCNVVGFEINPYAALASQVKLSASLIPVAHLHKEISAFERFMRRSCRSAKKVPLTVAPDGFKGRTELFHPTVQRKALFALDYINSIGERPIRNIFRLAFGSVMVSFSNYSYEPSLTRRISVGKPAVSDADVTGVMVNKLSAMAEDIITMQAFVRTSTARPESRVIADSVLNASKYLRDERVDLVVTSPPYLNNYHYPRNTRPQIAWLGLAKEVGYAGANETKSFGKFWQTVREEPRIALKFQLKALDKTISNIAEMNTEKGSYGGRGWANYAATYFNDTLDFCAVLSTLMRPGSAAVIVLGNSVIQGVEVKTDYWFGKIAELQGLEFEETVLLRNKRAGNSIINSSVRTDKAPARAVLYETAIILRKRV